MKKLITYAMIVAVAISVGTVAGVLGKRLLVPATVDYEGLEPEKMKVDCEKVVDSIDSYKGSSKIIDAFSASDVLNYSLEKFRRSENFASFTFGLADTIVKQDIRACQIRNGNEYFEESVSKSKMVSVGSRMYQHGKNGDVSLYDADASSINISDNEMEISYKGSSAVDYKREDYSSTFGKTLDEVLIYLICPESISSSNYITTADGYEYTVELDKDISTYFYNKQMINVSHVSNVTFKDVKLTYYLSENLKLNRISIVENYSVVKGVPVDIHGTLDMYFYSDYFVKIPEISEDLVYIRGDKL